MADYNVRDSAGRFTRPKWRAEEDSSAVVVRLEPGDSDASRSPVSASRNLSDNHHVADSPIEIQPFRIDDLPVEIFHHILTILRDIDSPGADVDRSLGWLRITHVSKSWRSAAISYKAMWTRIPLRHVGNIWANTFIERSDPLPIDFDFGYRLVKGRWADILSDNFHRTRGIETLGNSEDTLYNILAHPSQKLERLVLERPWHELKSPRLRAHQYPRLHTLHLIVRQMHAECIPWRDLGGPNLRELKVHVIHPRHDDYCLPDIVFALKRLDSLMHFELITSRPPNRLDSATRIEESLSGIYLPQLQQITLRADGEMILRILDYVTFPTSVEVTLIPNRAIHRRSFYSKLLPWISKHSELSPLKAISFTAGHRMGQESVQFGVSRSLEFGRAGFLRLQLDSTLQDALHDILYSLDPETVRGVYIDALTLLSLSNDHMLPRTSSLCHGITFISALPEATSNDAAGALSAILRRLLLPTPDANTTTSHPFPSLATLDLSALEKDMLSARCTHFEDAKPYRVMPPTLAQSVVDVVRARQEAGGNLHRVYLREWAGPLSRFEVSVLDVTRTIPCAEFLPKGSSAPLLAHES